MFENRPATQGENVLNFETASFASGVYLYQLSDGTNTIQAGKLVITK